MRNSIVVLLVSFFLGGAVWGQDLHWIANDSFTTSFTSNDVVNTKSVNIYSYLVSADQLESSATSGSLSVTGFEVLGAAATNSNFSGNVTIGLSTTDNPNEGYKLRILRSNLVVSTGGGGGMATTRVFVYDPSGSIIGQLNNVTLSSSNVLSITKTGSNTLVFKYNTTTLATVTNASDTYRAVVSTTKKGLGLTYNQSNFVITESSYPLPSVTDTNKNWTSVKTFDTSGALTSASVGYFDCLGRGTQAQTKDILTGKNWATQTLYDTQGRAALSTMSAPINADLDFTYKNGFIKDNNGGVFDSADFETNPELPSTVSTAEGTLGNYYSTQNTLEPFQDITDRPYTRTIYDELNPGKARAVVGGNSAQVSGESGLQYNFPQGYGHTMPAAQELYYAFGKDYFPENSAGWFAAHGLGGYADNPATQFISHRATKSVSIDAHGNESVVFTDLEGRTLAAARSGGTTEYSVVSLIGAQGYVDVHLPKGTSNSDISFIGGSGGYTVWDLRTGEQVTNLSAMTGGHIYRIERSPQSLYDTVLYIDTNGTTIGHTGAAKGLRYKVNYYDYALNYYDDAGNLLESVQPLGFDNGTLSSLNTTPQHSMASGYDYNSLGQLLSTNSPDEGSASFVYRKDGQIRFSRNTKQEEDGTFSYTNYDSYARPIESGLCEDDYPGGTLPTGTVNSFNFVADVPGNFDFGSDDVRKIANNGSTGNNWNKGSFYGTDVIEGDFRLSWTTAGSTVFLGLSNNDTGTYWSHIDYTIYRYGSGSLRVAENGGWKDYQAGYSDGDILSIERVGTTITYRWGDVVLHQNFTASDQPLHLDGNTWTTGTALQDIKIEYLNPTTTVPDDFIIDSAACTERTFTMYDLPDVSGLNGALTGSFPLRGQEFLAGNVSKTWTEDPSTSATWYSYDVYGRVTWMVQDIIGLGTKIIDYSYDDVTGAVTKVKYSGEQNEEFTHKYTYNQIGQLVAVATSYDGLNFKEQASYAYYETGALKRTVLAEGVQGVDYVYNISGALKSINHPSLSASKDPGGDADDVFGMIIDYHKKDYRRNVNGGVLTSNSGINRYDGNIKSTRWAIDNEPESAPVVQNAYQYEYDHNKWLKQANFGVASSSGTITPNSNNDYRVSNLNYDANGNLLSLARNKNTFNSSNTMDNFAYTYTPDTNQLEYVSDSATSNEDAGDLESQSAGNYTYNSIGQLTNNAQDQIQYNYTTSGLVSSIESTNSLENLAFTYNDRGHRIKKRLTGSGPATETYYVRDASGQPMAIYNGTGAQNIEYPIYGASRVGMSKNGDDRYEITDHLGNVRAVVQAPDGGGGNSIVFSDDFEDTVVAPWQTGTHTPVMTGGYMKLTLQYGQSGPSTYTPITLEQGHQYRISYAVKGLSPNTQVVTGIITTSGLDMQESGNIGAGSHVHIYTASYSGTYNLYVRSTGFGSGTYNAYFNDVVVEDITPGDTDGDLLQAYRDYYPFGMPMPNRYAEGDYRYAFQGQEKDPETGKEAFELRLWDSRIGRWLTTDPAGQYHSPYMAMGNNPISKIDPDGAKAYDWYVGVDGELEWHAGSGDIEGLTWVGTDSASHQYLSDIGQIFGGSGSVPGFDVLQNFFGGVTTSFDSGFEDSVNDGIDFVQNDMFRAGYYGESLYSFGQDVAGGRSLLFNASDAYLLGVGQGIAGMSINDWAYAAGYSAPGAALSFGGGYALSSIKLSFSFRPRASLFKIHPRLLDQDIAHRSATFFRQEIISNGSFGVKNYKTIYFNHKIGNRNFSIGINPWKRSIFHEGPGTFK